MGSPDYIREIGLPRSQGVTRRNATSQASIFERPSVYGTVWALVDLLTVAISTVMALHLRIVFFPDAYDPASFIGVLHEAPHVLFVYMAWFGLCLVFLSRSYKIYAPVSHCSGLHEQRMTIQACLTAGMLLCGALYLSRGEVVSRIVILMVIALTCVLLCARRAIWRAAVYKRYEEGIDTRNVLIVGTGRVGQALRYHIESLKFMGFRFKGYIALTEQEAVNGGPDVVGDLRNFIPVARALFTDEIFLSVPCEKRLVTSLVSDAREAGIDVRVVPDLYDGLAWNAQVEYVGQFPTIPLHRKEFPMGAHMAKRALDLLLSSMALIVLSPIMLAIAIAVRMDSDGPILFRSFRIGLKGRQFVCYKFRTMVKDAEVLKADLEHKNERDGVLFKIADDPRITRVGRFLRKYSLDEIPQFYNVLIGDMSMVGPRPPIASEVEQYDVLHLRRLDVLPGITGLWQVEARQDPSFDSYISLDTAYVDNWDLAMDIKILIRTIGVVLGGTGS